MVQQIDGLSHLFSAFGGVGRPHAVPDQAAASQVRAPKDRISISSQAKLKSQEQTGAAKDEKDLGSEEKQQVNELKKRDAEVKAHEAAHMAAGGTVVQGGASYEYQRGPDGKMYAVGGEVKIDMSPGNTPDATIRKMQQVKAAALAPAQPSGTDRAVAARAAQLEAQARLEKSQALQKPEGDNPTDQANSESSVASENGADNSPFKAYKADLSPSRPISRQAVGRMINLSV